MEQKKWHCPWCKTPGQMSKDEFVKLPVSGSMAQITCPACKKNFYHALSKKEQAEHVNRFVPN